MARFICSHILFLLFPRLFFPLSLIPFVSSSLVLFSFIWQSFVFTTLRPFFPSSRIQTIHIFSFARHVFHMPTKRNTHQWTTSPHLHMICPYRKVAI